MHGYIGNLEREDRKEFYLLIHSVFVLFDIYFLFGY